MYIHIARLAMSIYRNDRSEYAMDKLTMEKQMVEKGFGNSPVA